MFKSVKSLKTRFGSSKRKRGATASQAGPSIQFPAESTLPRNGNGKPHHKVAVQVEVQTSPETQPSSQAADKAPPPPPPPSSPPSPGPSSSASLQTRHSQNELRRSMHSQRSNASHQSTDSQQSQHSSHHSAPHSPARPSRPISPGISEATYPEAQIASATAPRFSRTPSFNQPNPSPVPPAYSYSRHNVRYSTYGAQVDDAPHVADSTWFVPVAVLDKAVYPFEYQFGGTIGEGGFGKVLLGLNLETRQQHAIKVIAIRRLRSRRETSSVANEIKALWRVSQSECPFLARPARVRDWFWQYRENIHLVMEYYKGGDLGGGCDRHPELRDPRRFKLMVAEVVIAILCLHDMQIVHHDIKPSNILVDSEGHCVLTDYGGSYITATTTGVEEKSASWRKGTVPIFTVRYAAPEVLLDGPVETLHTSAADFWSLGATLFELATGHDLVDEIDDDQTVFTIREGRIDFGQLVFLSPYPGLRQLAFELLNPDPAQRLQGHDVKSHDYFTEFSQRDWTAIYMKQRPPFRPNKQLPVNPRNTSYDFVDRPGEALLDDANEDIVIRWLTEDGVGLPHHRNSDYHRRHRNNARVGLPELARGKAEAEGWGAEEYLPVRI